MKSLFWKAARLSALVLLAACGTNPLAVESAGSEALTLRVGQELDLTVGTLGPGAYEAPVISTGSLVFLGDSLVGPYTPAGPRQLFRFRGAAVGQAIVVLHHSGNEPTITDTVLVR
jgi:hypothetical protein